MLLLESALRALLIAALLVGCSSDASEVREAEPIRLWHTFGGAETEALNESLADREGRPVEVTRIGFARGHVVLSEILAEGTDCPDLLRIDATWLAALAPRLRPAPDALAGDRDWLPEALELATVGGVRYGLPQAIDGLVLMTDRGTAGAGDWPPRSLEALAGRGDRRYRLDIRVDAYWFLPFLRAGGGDVIDPAGGTLGVDQPGAIAALDGFAALFSGDAPRAIAGAGLRGSARRLADRQVGVIIEGPWAISELESAGIDLAIAAFPVAAAAPRGGQLFVVPRCARRPDGGWALAAELTAPEIQSRWGRELGLVPTTRAGLAGAGPLAAQIYAALARGTPLPAHALTPELFDDLSPAIAAVVAGDATATEALAGVERAWRRLAARHGVDLRSE